MEYVLTYNKEDNRIKFTAINDKLAVTKSRKMLAKSSNGNGTLYRFYPNLVKRSKIAEIKQERN